MSLEAAADELQRRARPVGRKGPLDEEALHDAILREVEERWEHLEAMRAAGKARRCALTAGLHLLTLGAAPLPARAQGAEHEARIRGEIAQRVAQLRKLESIRARQAAG